MGLFIGASILTILELFDYIYEVTFSFSLVFYSDRKQPHFSIMLSVSLIIVISWKIRIKQLCVLQITVEEAGTPQMSTFSLTSLCLKSTASLTFVVCICVLSQVIKYKLCRCSEKKHKHSNNNDQGAVLSLDDVKCHVSNFH